MFYLPLLSSHAEDQQTEKISATLEEVNSAQVVSEEFIVGLRKFASHLRRTIQQVEGDVKLLPPSISPAVLAQVEKCVSDTAIIPQVCAYTMI